MDELEHDMWCNKEELTPKPLRIVKREPKVTESGAPLNPTDVVVLSSVTEKPLHQVPRRTTSISSNTSTDFSSYSEIDEDALFGQVDSSSVISSTSLNVQKRRRNDSKNSIQKIDTSSIETSISPVSSTKTATDTKASSRPSNPYHTNQNRDVRNRGSSLGNGFKLQSDLSANVLPSHRRTSQQTTLGSIPGHLVAPHHRQSSSDPTSTVPASVGKHQANTNHTESPAKDQHKVNGRKPSKHGFLNRLVAGFVVGDGEPTNSLMNSKPGVELPRQARSASARKYTMAKLGPATTNSSKTQTSFHNNTDRAVTAPNPPVPDSGTGTSQEICPQAVPPSTRSAKPQENPILGAKLTLASERDCVSITSPENESSFFVAIEVKGVVGSTSHGGGILDKSNALDVAIIVDNSLYTSPTSLLSSCDVASAVAATLDSSLDRLSLFKTSSSKDDSHQGYPVLPLCLASQGKMRTALNSIMGSATQTQPDYMVAPIKKAQFHLIHDVATENARRQGRTSLSHIILLTGNLDAIPNSAHDHRYTELHVVCPSSVPRQSKPAASGAGWRLHVYPQNSMPVRAVPLAKGNSFYDEIHAMILHLRRHARADLLTDLRLGIKPEPQCSIEGIMGHTRLPYLRPGEAHIVMVKVRIQSSQIGTGVLANFSQFPRTATGTLEVLKEIDAILRDRSVPLLKVQLSYRHTGLPEETVCKTARSIKIKLCNLDAYQTNASSGHFATQHEKLIESACNVRRRLVHHLATHQSPAHALKTIIGQFNPKGTVPLSSEYLNLTIAELRYQSRINQRLEFANDQVDKFEGYARQTLSSQRQYQSENIVHDSPTLVVNDEDKLSFESGEFSDSESEEVDCATDQASLLSSRDSTDHARQIWGELRKSAKGEDKNEIDGARSPQSCDSHETMKQIKDFALKNKRSIGQDTLQSIAYRDSRKGNVTPWL